MVAAFALLVATAMIVGIVSLMLLFEWWIGGTHKDGFWG